MRFIKYFLQADSMIPAKKALEKSQYHIRIHSGQGKTSIPGEKELEKTTVETG
jgi:hypothetical protein